MDDRIGIQSILRFYWSEIPYDEIEEVEIGNPPVFWDMIKRGYFSRKYAFGFRILKNDLADLFRHTTIKKNGYWKQIRITPKDPEKFFRILSNAMRQHRKQRSNSTNS